MELALAAATTSEHEASLEPIVIGVLPGRQLWDRAFPGRSIVRVSPSSQAQLGQFFGAQCTLDEVDENIRVLQERGLGYLERQSDYNTLLTPRQVRSDRSVDILLDLAASSLSPDILKIVQALLDNVQHMRRTAHLAAIAQVDVQIVADVTSDVHPEAKAEGNRIIIVHTRLDVEVRDTPVFVLCFGIGPRLAIRLSLRVIQVDPTALKAGGFRRIMRNDDSAVISAIPLRATPSHRDA